MAPTVSAQVHRYGGLLNPRHVFLSTMKCDIDVRQDFCSNVVLSGGTSIFLTVGVRMTKEFTALGTTMRNKVVVAPVKVFSDDWRVYPVFPKHPSFVVNLDFFFFLRTSEESGRGLSVRRSLADLASAPRTCPLDLPQTLRRTRREQCR